MAVDNMLELVPGGEANNFFATLANTIRICVDYHPVLDKPLHRIRSNAAVPWVFESGT